MSEQKVHPFIATLKNRQQQDEFRERFVAFLDEVDEPLLFPEGVTNKHIFSVFNSQGYWAGVRYRVELSDDGIFSVSPRHFGVF